MMEVGRSAKFARLHPGQDVVGVAPRPQIDHLTSTMLYQPRTKWDGIAHRDLVRDVEMRCASLLSGATDRTGRPGCRGPGYGYARVSDGRGPGVFSGVVMSRGK